MSVNKKLDRLRQWSKEKIGAEGRTGTSEEIKGMMNEMELLQGGFEKTHKAMHGYVKSVSKQVDDISNGQDTLPLGHLGSTMLLFGQEFDHTSSLGRRLVALGRSDQDLARLQKHYGSRITASWLQSIERSLTQLKEFTVARKRLESRRLAFDAAQAKGQKSRKDDFRTEEEVRLQKVKYEEASEEVYRRMLDIKDGEQVNVADLGEFLDAQLAYHEQSLARLQRTKLEWMESQPPASAGSADWSSFTAEVPAIRNRSYDDLPRKISSPHLHYERSTSSLRIQSAAVPFTNLSGVSARREPPPPPPPRSKKPPPPIPDKRST